MAEPEVVGAAEFKTHRRDISASSGWASLALRRQEVVGSGRGGRPTAEALQEKIMTDRRFPPPRSVEEPDPKSSLF
jgi:hypothetical protein